MLASVSILLSFSIKSCGKINKDRLRSNWNKDRGVFIMSATHPAIKRKQDLKVAGTVYIQGNAAWHAGNLSKSEFAPASHVGAGGSAHAVATTSQAGFLSAADKTKLDGIQSGAINQTTADGRYLRLTGGTLTGALTVTTGAGALTLKAGNTSDHIYIEFFADSQAQTTRSAFVGFGTAGSNVFTIKNEMGDNIVFDTTAEIYKGSYRIWHEGNFNPANKSDVGHTHTTAQITDLATKHYTKTEVDTLLAAKGDVKSNTANTFTMTNTFSNAGVAVKIQPSSAVSGRTVLFQVNNSLGNNLITMGTWDTDETKAKLVVNGDLEVTGSTIQRATQEIEGDMNVTGNLNVAGNSILGDSAADQTTIRGDLRLEGTLKQINRYIEVARFPVYGIGGDLQFQTDSTTFEDIIHHYSTFDTNGGSCIPPVGSGAARYYKLLVVYSSTGTDASRIRIIQQNTTNEICSFVLPAVNGSTDSTARTWISAPFSTSHIGNTAFQAKKDVSGELAIRYIEIIAYDYYS